MTFIIGPHALEFLHRLGRQFFDFLLVLCDVLLVFLGRIHIGRRGEVGIVEHGDDGDDNGLDAEDGTPPFLGVLLRIERVHAGRVKNRNAHLAVGIYYAAPSLDPYCSGATFR